MSKIKTIAAALALAVAATGGLAAFASDSADAKGFRRVVVFKGGGHHHHHHFRHRFITPVVTVGSGPGCGFYWRRWQATGSYYWKNRYFDCIG